MFIKVRCTEAVGNAIIRLFAAMELIAADYKPEDLQFEIGDERASGGGPRTQYWAKLPRLDTGLFDMAAVDVTVRENLQSLGEHTINGIVYNDIVNGTIDGAVMTEPGIRAARMMKAGSSQRAVQQLFHAGLIDRGHIKPSSEV